MSVMEASLDAEKQNPPFDIASCLSGVGRRAGKNPGSQAMDIAKLAFGFGNGRKNIGYLACRHRADAELCQCV